MTLEELYREIGGDYAQAARVLRVEKLIDKHIRKFPQNGVAEELLAAGKEMDANRLFESAHALKGICSNLGLVRLAEAASRVTEEYRPGTARSMSDGEVAELLREIESIYRVTTDGIRRYTEG